MSGYLTVIKLISLNANDFINVAEQLMNNPEAIDVEGTQARMIGHAKLLQIWIEKLMEHYGALSSHEGFQKSVEDSYKYHIQSSSTTARNENE